VTNFSLPFGELRYHIEADQLLRFILFSKIRKTPHCFSYYLQKYAKQKFKNLVGAYLKYFEKHIDGTFRICYNALKCENPSVKIRLVVKWFRL